MRTLCPILFVAAITTLACDNGTNPEDQQPVAITFSAVGNRTSIADSAQLGDSLIITRVQLVMSELELDRTADDSVCTALRRSSGGPGGNSESKRRHDEERRRDCPSIDLGPFLVSLTLSSSPVTRFASDIPAGTYREIEFEINRPQDDSAGVAFIASNPDFRDISVRAEGTFRGRPFIYTGRAKAELELEFRPSLTVETTGTIVHIRVDLAKWFRTPVGVAVDPASANPGGLNAGLVARNIAASFSLVAGA